MSDQLGDKPAPKVDGEPLLAGSGYTVMRPVKKKKKRVGRVALTFILSVTTILVATAAVFGWFLWRLSSTFNAESEVIPMAIPETSRPATRDDGAQTILLLGSDTRAHVDKDDIDTAQDGRADVIMVVRVPADHKDVYVMSIMRDSWVDIPGYGDNKINAAFAFGGAPLMVETVESLIGSRIDHVAIIDFESFKGMTNALGGVTVYNAKPFKAGGYTFPVGEIDLDGDEALAFVRERKSFVDGDYQRVRNQQAYLKGLISKLLSRDTLTSPSKITGTVDALSPYLARDEGLDVSYLIGEGFKMRGLRPSDIFMFTIPTAGVGWSPDGTQSIIELDWEAMEDVREAFETDTVDRLID